MTVLKNFEARVIDLLTQGVLSAETIAALKEDAELVDYHTTGNGYFLTVRHPGLPTNRIVCDRPTLIGESRGVDTGFVIFIEDGELTIECHGWGDKEIPIAYRDQDVRITATAI